MFRQILLEYRFQLFSVYWRLGLSSRSLVERMSTNLPWSRIQALSSFFLTELVDREGKYAVDIAKRNDSDDIVSLLQEHRCNSEVSKAKNRSINGPCKHS